MFARAAARFRATRSGGPGQAGGPGPLCGPLEPPMTLEAVFERERLDTENMRRLVAFSLRPDSCCVDVGAHRGGLLQEIVRVAPHGRHIAYEPLPHLAAHLREHFHGVDVRQCALSNRAGSATFEHVRGAAEGCSGFVVCTAPPGYADDVEQIDVQLERLDDALTGDDPLSLLKLDVEGAEQQVFEGAMQTIRRARPIVLFEHTFAACNAYGTDPRTIYELLCEQAGLRLFDLNGNGPFTGDEFDRLSRRGDPVNFVAHV